MYFLLVQFMSGAWKTRLFKYIENFSTKMETKSDIFHIPAQNIDFGYSLEPPWREAVLTSTQNLCF